jgi:hypothetical protein
MNSTETCNHCHSNLVAPSYERELHSIQSHLRCGTMPSPVELACLDSIIPQVNSETARYDRALDYLRQATRELESKRASLQAISSGHGSLRSIARTLPSELLLEIFSHVENASIAVQLARVCKRWNEALASSSSCFTEFRLEIIDQINVEEHHAATLKRSGSLPLSVTCWSNHKRHGAKFRIRDFLLLPMCSSRLVTLNLLHPNHYMRGLGTLPALETLFISGATFDTLHLFLTTPNLKTLTLDAPVLDYSNHLELANDLQALTMLRQVQTLSLWDCEHIEVWGFLLFYSLHPSQCQEIRLIGCAADWPSNMNSFDITLPNISTFCMIDWNHRTLFDPYTPIDIIKIPMLKSLVISGCPCADLSPNEETLGTLENLELSTGPSSNPSSEFDVTPFLGSASAVKSLSVNDDNMWRNPSIVTAALIYALTIFEFSTPFAVNPNGPVNLMPALETLELTLARDKDYTSLGNSLVCMVESRRRYDRVQTQVSVLRELQLNIAPADEVDVKKCHEDTLPTIQDLIGAEAFKRLENMREDGLTFITSLSPTNHYPEWPFDVSYCAS